MLAQKMGTGCLVLAKVVACGAACCVALGLKAFWGQQLAISAARLLKIFLLLSLI
jgi:hypothetical protein